MARGGIFRTPIWGRLIQDVWNNPGLLCHQARIKETNRRGCGAVPSAGPSVNLPVSSGPGGTLSSWPQFIHSFPYCQSGCFASNRTCVDEVCTDNKFSREIKWCKMLEALAFRANPAFLRNRRLDHRPHLLAIRFTA